MLHYYSILEFFHSIPMQVLLLCSNYAHFIIEKTPRTQSNLITFQSYTHACVGCLTRKILIIGSPLCSTTSKLTAMYSV